MQVQSRSNTFSQTPRSAGLERKTDDSEAAAAAARARRDDAITGSQAVLSNSLADALWSIQRSSAVEDHVTARSVEDMYRAYAF